MFILVELKKSYPPFGGFSSTSATSTSEVVFGVHLSAQAVYRIDRKSSAIVNFFILPNVDGISMAALTDRRNLFGVQLTINLK